MKGKDEVIKFYNSFTKQQGVNERHFSILAKLLTSGLQEHHTVLELGCGTGSLTGLLAKYLRNGNITSIDISPESINIASKNLSNFTNLKLIANDITVHEFGKTMFDVIVLPDVLEHVPLESHFNLFEKISQILKPSGFVFIHIPNPAYLEWCIKNRPEILQIIDQPIYTSELTKNIYPHGFYIHELKTYPIWVRDCDYQYIVLRKSDQSDFSVELDHKPSFWEKVKYKIGNKK